MTEVGVGFPEGPVTIMFTDIVGSTALRTKLGDLEADGLFRAHDEIVRTQIVDNRGQDQKAALGDGFLATFVSTRRALAAAVGIQRAIDAFNRARSGSPLAVRVGINTGEVAWQDGALSGEAVHAASRVCAAANGGQILVSDVTRQLAGTVADLSFLEAGEFDLKGFPQPWRLWEVIWIRETTQRRDQVFVGREAELGFLRDKLAEAIDGHGGLVLLGGEPGVGKTTIVRQLIRDAQARGALALFGRCYEFEGSLPYSPFIEMLEQSLELMPPEMVREDMGVDAPEVARMVPELRRRFPDIPEPLDLPPEQQRRYFFNAVGSFISRGATRFPLVLVMDDVHWADEPTLLLIEHMAELMPEIRVLGVGTYRDVELDVSRPLAATLERLVRSRRVERVPVKRFDRAGVGTMIDALAGRTPPDALVDAIYDEAEGNPFFVEEVYRHLVEEGKVFDDAGEFRADIKVDELDVPESVRLVVGRRLQRLGGEAQKALAAGAVVGRGFPFSLLEQITDVDVDALLDIVEEAEAARVIVAEERGGEVHYTFAHELIRQTLLSGCSLLRRQRLHLAVADAIERHDSSAPDTRPSEIAQHLLQAGAAADPQRTLRYLERTADHALAAAAFEEALRWIDDALAIVGDGDRLRRAQLLERRGLVQRAFGNYEQSLATWAGVVETYAEHEQLDAVAELSWEMGYQLVWLNRFPEAFETYNRGLELLGDRSAPAKPALMSSVGLLTGFAGGFDASLTQLAQAEALAVEVGDTRSLARVAWSHCIVDWSFARLPEARSTGLRAVELCREAGDEWSLVDALAWVAFPLGSLGAFAEGESLALEAFAIAQRLGHVTGEALARRALLLNGCIKTGDLAEMESAIRAELKIYETIRTPWVSQAMAWLACVLTLHGRLDEARALADESIAIEPASAWSGVGWMNLLMNRSYAGDHAAVRSMVEPALPELTTLSSPPPMGRFLMASVAGEACAVAGFPDLVESLYPVLLTQPALVPLRPFDWALTERVVAMAAAATGRWDEAEQHFTAALEQAERYADVIDLPQVQHFFGKMFLDRGLADDHIRGRALVTAAVDGYRRLDIPIRAAMAEALLA